MQIKGIDRTVIKWIAMISMLIDHIGYGLIPDTTPWLKALGIVCNVIGRSAFPLFLFLLADGFMRTRSKPKFFIRLLSLAIISEVPFDLVCYHTFLSIIRQNVFWTLLFFFAYMWVSDVCIQSAKAHGLEATNKWTILVHVVAGIMAVCAATIFRTDYNGVGVLAGIVMYHFLAFSREHPVLHDIPVYIMGYTIGLGILTFFFGNTLYAFPTILLIWNYRGRCEIKMPKWIGYAFYPTHLAVIALVLFLQGRLF